MNQLTNKTLAVFGTTLENNNFINFLNNNNIEVIILDNVEFNLKVNKNNLISFLSRNEVNWKNIECLVTNQDDINLFELAKKNACQVYCIIEFFIKYFPDYNYIGLIGESGSSISADLLKYLFCKLKLNIEYELCKKNLFFTLYKFGKTNNYIFELNQEKFTSLKSPYFNDLIIFDLQYNKEDIEKIKYMLLNQNENDLAIINVDNKNIKELYQTIKDNENYKSNIVQISIKKILKNGVSFVNNEIYVNLKNKNEEYLTNEFKNLSGDQNKINILAILTLMIHKDYQTQEVIENLYNFKTCDDIFELVLHKENFTFINDIKNKNKLQSLVSFDNIYWILCIDEIDFEFDEFLNSIQYFKKIKYVFIIGNYNEDILKIFRDNEINYFIMYNMKNIIIKIESLIEIEKREEKINVLLSSINDITDNIFYEKCSEEFEKIINEGE